MVDGIRCRKMPLNTVWKECKEDQRKYKLGNNLISQDYQYYARNEECYLVVVDDLDEVWVTW